MLEAKAPMGSTFTWAPPAPPGGAKDDSRPFALSQLQIACAAVLGLTVAFNPLLALVNASVMPVSGTMVAIVQGALIGSALLLGLYACGRAASLWIALVWMLALVSLATAAVRAQFDPKSLGDVLLIPAFVLMGMQLTRTTFIRTVVMMQAAILIVGIWEVLYPVNFGSVFKVAQYYINSRGYEANDFWAGGDLFVSATRPHGRMLLPNSGLHRGSSLFLEPVSLGNWTIMITLFTAGLWRDLSVKLRVLLIASNMALLVVCDGRLALGVNLMLIAVLPVVRFIPGWISIVYLPFSLLLLTVAKMLGLLAEVGDTFAGRLRYGIEALGRLNVQRFFAIGESRTGNEDAGLVYFIQNQTLPVAIILWITVTLASTGETGGGRAFKHGMAIFLVACLPISNASLSIKTTALMWTCFGFFYARAKLASFVAEADSAKAPTGLAHA
ncbi:MAG: polysaccharide biosynthesis protein GumE [Sphingobium sp.]|uniref:polysaccharide biosynthesis protein GumE n=1 Tax=Sphingobium sp. TaxID=1912891 RepID=UPI0029B40390|nr:polysaccharide biosynthesis protein GumE [Sphingobium sp.]MDX3908901.1 polysaccharide biosynthesis protein GumE [Sphingobium sp.]